MLSDLLILHQHRGDSQKSQWDCCLRFIREPVLSIGFHCLVDLLYSSQVHVLAQYLFMKALNMVDVQYFFHPSHLVKYFPARFSAVQTGAAAQVDSQLFFTTGSLQKVRFSSKNLQTAPPASGPTGPTGASVGATVTAGAAVATTVVVVAAHS